MKHIVSMKWLLARLYEPDLVIVDCRFTLSDPHAGRKAYEEAYIPGAIYLDLERDLSAPVQKHGGRHPLPDLTALAQKLSRLGISNHSRIVAYDDQGGAVAARFWWLLQYMGHDQVYVMEQSFTAWKEAGYPVISDQPPIRVPSRFEPIIQKHMLAGVEEVRVASLKGSAVLIDSREHRRYAGIEEPIDKKAGHIPGAINYFWKDNLKPNGQWKSTTELSQRFADLPQDRDIIIYCGSGVTACPNVLALQEAGFENVKLYVGSWSDWISYSENPIAIKQ